MDATHMAVRTYVIALGSAGDEAFAPARTCSIAVPPLFSTMAVEVIG